MPKFFVRSIFCSFLLIWCLFFNFWTLFVFVCIVLIVVKITSRFCCESNVIKKPGTVSRCKIFVTKKTYISSKSKLIKSPCVEFSESNILNCNLVNFNNSDKSSLLSGSLTDMSFVRSSNSPSVGLFDSPVRRSALSSNNSLRDSVGSPLRDNYPSNSSANESFHTPVRGSASRISESGSSKELSVGEFPLISLVSSLHEAVSPKKHKLKPSPITIRIQPPKPPEQLKETVVDPVVSVLKQITSNKRVLAPSCTASGEDEQKEKRCRSMPRHDLTHSLLETQLTSINSSREACGSKREREEVHIPISLSGSLMSGTPPKRICARTLRSNEILSSLSSSLSLASPQSSKTYTGKRKNVAFDKYSKLRRMEEESNQVKLIPSPAKVDKAVNVEPPLEKEKSSLPVISIKRDEVSERVVSRAMVSALLKSVVSKLIMSGDPGVYPVPNGTQPRQPEVSLAEFGPPSSSSSLTAVSCAPSSLPSFSVGTLPSNQKTVELNQPPPTLGFSVKLTSGASSITSQTVTTSSPSISLSSGTGAQTTFSLTNPQVSTSVVPSSGLSSTTPSSTPTVQFNPPLSSSVLAKPPMFGLPKTPAVSAGLPVFGVPSTSTGVTTSTPSFAISSASFSSVTPKTPSFGFVSTSVASAGPNFGQVPLPSTVSTTQVSSSPSVTTVSTNPLIVSNPTSSTVNTGSTSFFSSVTTPSSNQIKFGAGTSTSSTPLFSGSISAATPATATSTSIFGASTTSAPIFGGTSTTGTTGSIFSSVLSPPAFSSAPSTTTSTPTTSAPLFSSVVSSSSSSTPIFGSTVVSSQTPLFGSSISNIKPPITTSTTGTTATPSSTTNFFTTTSKNIFGGPSTTSAPVFGASNPITTSAPLFGGPAQTTSSSIFNNFTGNPTTATPVFGGSTTTSSTPLFGGVVATSTTSVFGGSSSTVTTPQFGSTFTATPVTTATPLFGASTSTTTTTTSSTPLFGGALTTSAPLFGGTNSTTVSSSPLFGATTTSQTPLFGSVTSTGFGTTSTPKPSEGLFGMPPSNSGFKAIPPFPGAGTNYRGSTGPAFGSSATPAKPFEFSGSKPASGGFTFKPATTPASAPFAPQPQTEQPAQFSSQPAQSPFNFTGSGGTVPNQSTSSPFVFGSPSQPAATSNEVKPFQFGSGSSSAPAPPAFGQFAPTFGQAGGNAAPSFGGAAAPGPGAFQFNAAPTNVPGGASGLFSIGTGSTTGNRSRDRRDRRRR